MKNRILTEIKDKKYFILNKHLCRPLNTIEEILNRFAADDTSRYQFAYGNDGELQKIPLSRNPESYYDVAEEYYLIFI